MDFLKVINYGKRKYNILRSVNIALTAFLFCWMLKDYAFYVSYFLLCFIIEKLDRR